MAILALDGFDGGGTVAGDSGNADMVAYLESRYIASNMGTGVDRPTTQPGWGSGQALSWGRGSSAGARYFNVDIGTQTDIRVGFALQSSKNLDSPTSNIIISFRDELNAVDHITLNCVNGTHFVFSRGSTVLASALALRQGVWAYVEIRVVIHNTTGIIEARINGVEIINATGLDTVEGGVSTSIDTVRMRGARGEAGSTDPTRQWLIDDLYVDTTTFHGPIKIETLFPTAEGGTINFTPSTGTDNALNVDENPRDDDTTYNSSADTPGNKDLLAAGNLSVVSSGVIGVQITSDAKLDAAGSIGLQSIVFQNLTQGTGVVVEVSSTAAYLAVQHIFATNPDTALAWTPTQVNAMEIGYEID